MSTPVSYEKIKIKGPWKILTIHSLVITKTLNTHAKCWFKVLISEKAGNMAAQKETENDCIECYIEDNNNTCLFKGFLKDVKVENEGGVYYLSATCLSYSALLDIKEKSRSFQNKEANYNDIAAEVLKDYQGKSIEIKAGNTKVAGPVIQYKETDWQFLKRLASCQNEVVVANANTDKQIISFGYPKWNTKNLPDKATFSRGKNFRDYYVAFLYDANVKERDYANFTVETYEQLDIGNKINFESQDMYVKTVTASLNEGLLVYTVELVKEAILRQNPIKNLKMQGVTLEGKILNVEKQTVKLELFIDQKVGRIQKESEAYPFPFSPSTTDMMYLMPEKDSTVCLYIPGVEFEKAIVVSSARDNGESCEKTGDPNIRYLSAAHGPELKIAPDGLFFTAGGDKLEINLDDKKGVIISSHKNITISTDEEVLIESKKKIGISSDKQIVMLTNSNAGFEFDSDLNFKGGLVNIIDETRELLIQFIAILDGFPDQPFPDGYREALIDRFITGELSAKKLFIEMVNSNSINTGVQNGSMYYNRSTNQIYLNYADDFTGQGTGVTFFHEVGHFTDYNTGTLSNGTRTPNSVIDSEFSECIRQDFEDRLRREAENLKNNTPGATFSTDPQDILNPDNWCSDYQTLFDNIGNQMSTDSTSAVSDIYSGISIIHNTTDGDVRIEGLWVHEIDYWDARPNGVYTEAAAHFYEAQFDPERKATLEEYFPTASKRFEEMLEGKLDE